MAQYGGYPGGQPPPGQAGYGQQPPGGYPGGHPAGHPGAGHPGQGYPGQPGQPGYQPQGQPGYQPQQAYGGAPPPGGAPPGVDPTVYQWFAAVDHDRSGRITSIELQQALTNTDWSCFNAETCRLMIGMFDRDQSGTIDINEFQGLWTYIQQWKGCFDGYDRDRSGVIEAHELTNAFSQLGYRLSPQFAQLVVSRYDTTGRRGLTLDNFIQSCCLLKSITDTFRQKDTAMQGSIQINYEEFMTMVMLNKP